MASRLEVRLPEETHGRLVEAARRDGVSVSEFVRRAVEDRVEGRSVRAIGEVVLRGLLRELLPQQERVIMQALQGGMPVAFTQVQQASTSLPSAFVRGCLDVDLHRQGQVCSSCGGSFNA